MNSDKRPSPVGAYCNTPLPHDHTPLPHGWRWVRLGDVCEINPRRSDLKRPEDAPTTFIPMSAVDEAGRGIARAEQRPYSEVKKGYTYFADCDVLFAKITPCMQNGKHAIARNLTDGVGFGSTEFHVLRPKSAITSQWVQQFLLQPWVLQEATAHFTGAVGQQRVPEGYLAELAVPLPPLSEQQRIAAVLTEQMEAVEQARRAAEARLEAAKALPAAYLRAVFNSPDAQQWPRKRVSELCDQIDYGFTASADFTRNEPRLLRITDIQNGHVDWEKVPGCPIRQDDEAANRLSDGDIVFARTGATTGKSFLIRQPPRAVFASYLIRLRPTNEVVSEFLYAFFQSDDYWQQIRASARGGAQPNVNATLLGAITVPIGPLTEQQRIATILTEQMAAVEQARKALQEELDTINKLPAALLRRAFSGGGL